MIPVYRPLQDLQATKTRDECLPYDLKDLLLLRFQRDSIVPS